jgi:EmrB/QacA subfamily drug resistance transporter
LGTAFFMVILDSTIVYVALPNIQQALDLSASGVQWVVSAYLVSFGGFLLLGGRSADLLGRRRVFRVGAGLFAASSLASGLAWSGEVLIASRVVQGISAAIMAPTALSLLITTFEDGPERNKALGIWGGIGGVGATAGLLLGGPITQALGWEWVFFVNVPVGVAVVILSPALLRESRDRNRPRTFDVAGAVTITASLLLVVGAITGAPQAGWLSTRTVGFLGASAASFGLSLLIESRSSDPLVPIRVLRSPTLVGGNIVLLAAGMSVDGVLFLLTLYAQEVLGYSTIQFGLMTATMTVMSVVGAYGGQAAVTRTGFRPIAATGMVLIGVACLLLTRVSVHGSFFDDMLLGLLVFGAGLGSAFVASQIAALASVADRDSGLAAGLVDTSFSMGGAIGLAVLSTVAASRTNEMLEAVGPAQRLLAMTEGFQSAFTVALLFPLMGLAAALFLLGRGGAAGRTSVPIQVTDAENSNGVASAAARDVGPVVWSSPSWHEQVASWIDQHLAAAGMERTGPLEQPHVRPWATVLRVPTSVGPVWLKAVGPNAMFEVGLYEILANVAPDRVLVPIATDVPRRWVLLPDGGVSLAERVSGGDLLDALVVILPQYGQLQRDLAPRVNDLLELGVADMCPKVMPRRFDEAFDAVVPYLERHGTDVDRDVHRRLPDRREAFVAWCDELASAPGAASLDHNDLHPWNMLVGTNGIHEAKFYDWGDGVVAHPFASMLVALGYVQRHVLAGADDDPQLLRLRDAYLEVFSDLASHAELVEAMETACRVAKVARALTWHRSLLARGNDGGQHAGAPMECLASLLDDSYLGGA